MISCCYGVSSRRASLHTERTGSPDCPSAYMWVLTKVYWNVKKINKSSFSSICIYCTNSQQMSYINLIGPGYQTVQQTQLSIQSILKKIFKSKETQQTALNHLLAAFTLLSFFGIFMWYTDSNKQIVKDQSDWMSIACERQLSCLSTDSIQLS